MQKFCLGYHFLDYLHYIMYVDVDIGTGGDITTAFKLEAGSSLCQGSWKKFQPVKNMFWDSCNKIH